MNLSDLDLLLAMAEVQEFYRLRSSLRAKQEHASLLEDFKEFDRTRLDLEDGVGSAEQTLLKEHAAISRNTGQVFNLLWLELYIFLWDYNTYFLFFFLSMGWDGVCPLNVTNRCRPEKSDCELKC